MWYFYYAKALGYNFPLLLFCDYLFINQILSFFPPTLLMSVLLCLAITLVRIPSITECLYHSSCTDCHTPLHPTPCNNPTADTMLLRLFTTHNLPYIKSVSRL